MKVVALYDFDAQPDTGEISITKDEIITVTRQDIGEGWWEGINSRSQKGLFPAEYVSPINNSEQSNHLDQSSWNDFPSSTSKPALVSFTQQSVNNPTNFDNSHFVDKNFDAQLSHHQPYDQDDADWGDEDWEDDDSQASEFTANDYSPTNPALNQIASINIGAVPKIQGSVKKSINRFSHFVKSGGEDYILGLKNLTVNQSDLIHIIFDEQHYKWSPSYFTLTVSVENPKKESKMKGLKSYIAYQLTPSDTGIPVSRRYKHFDWLHGMLQNKFLTIPIPSLPDKQISGRYQEDFIQNRRIQLQSWVNRICRHPVLSQSTVWKHFITCKDEKQWKNGKRRAEKDELVGALFFLTVQTPEDARIDSNYDNKLEQFFRFVNKLDESTKNIYNVSQEMIKRYQSFYRKEFSKIGSIFSGLGDSFGSAPSKNIPKNKSLISALNFTSETYESISRSFDDQHWNDFGPLSNLMHEYRGILSAWPEIYQVYKGSINKKKEIKKVIDDDRTDQELEKINQRADVVTFSTIAEMNHFEEERINDFNQIMRTFLNGQLNLYKGIVAKLEETLKKFDEQ